MMRGKITVGMIVGVILLGSGMSFAEEQVGAVGKSGFFKIMGGLGFASVAPSDEWAKSYQTPALGFGYEFGRGILGFEFDLMFIGKGEKYGWEGNAYNDPFEAKESFSILSLCALTKVGIVSNPSIYLLAGEASGVVLSRNYSFESGSYHDEWSGDPDSRLDVNLVFGAGAGSPKGRSGLFGEARYYLGLTKIEGSGKYNLFLILAGYRF